MYTCECEYVCVYRYACAAASVRCDVYTRMPLHTRKKSKKSCVAPS